MSDPQIDTNKVLQAICIGLEKLAVYMDISQHEKWCKRKSIPVHGFSGEGVLLREAAAELIKKDAELVKANKLTCANAQDAADESERAARAEAQLAEARKALDAIIERSYNDPLGTSKVNDMRQIARRAREAQGGNNG